MVESVIQFFISMQVDHAHIFLLYICIHHVWENVGCLMSRINIDMSLFSLEGLCKGDAYLLKIFLVACLQMLESEKSLYCRAFFLYECSMIYTGRRKNTGRRSLFLDHKS